MPACTARPESVSTSSVAEHPVLRVDHGDQAQQLLLAQDRHGQHRPRAAGVRGSRPAAASPSRPRPAGTTIGRSVRDPGRCRSVPARSPRPRSGSYSSSRPPRARVACTAVSSTAPISALQVVGRRQRLAVAGQRLLEPRPLAGQLGHPGGQLARHRVQRRAQLDQLVRVLRHLLAARAEDVLGAAGEVGERLRDAVGGEQAEPAPAAGRAARVRSAGAAARSRCGRSAPTAGRSRASWVGRPSGPGTRAPCARTSEPPTTASLGCPRRAPVTLPVRPLVEATIAPPTSSPGRPGRTGAGRRDAAPAAARSAARRR